MLLFVAALILIGLLNKILEDREEGIVAIGYKSLRMELEAKDLLVHLNTLNNAICSPCNNFKAWSRVLYSLMVE